MTRPKNKSAKCVSFFKNETPYNMSRREMGEGKEWLKKGTKAIKTKQRRCILLVFYQYICPPTFL